MNCAPTSAIVMTMPFSARMSRSISIDKGSLSTSTPSQSKMMWLNMKRLAGGVLATLEITADLIWRRMSEEIAITRASDEPERQAGNGGVEPEGKGQEHDEGESDSRRG